MYLFGCFVPLWTGLELSNFIFHLPHHTYPVTLLAFLFGLQLQFAETASPSAVKPLLAVFSFQSWPSSFHLITRRPITPSWLPYSTYLYLDFHLLLCSMTKLNEHSRDICYIPPIGASPPYFRYSLSSILITWSPSPKFSGNFSCRELLSRSGSKWNNPTCVLLNAVPSNLKQ